MQLYKAPNHLKEIVVDADSNDIEEIYKEIGTHSTSFKLKNPIDHLNFSWVDEYDCEGGIVWAVDEKGNETLLFHPGQHGYSAVITIYESEVPEDRFDYDAKKSTKIDSGSEVIISFQYNGDEEEMAKEGSYKSNLPKDFFDCFFIFLKVKGQLKMIYNYECA